MIIVIIGGGVVGLNCALTLSKNRPNDEIFLLEAEDYLGAHTSTRNSEVIHAGFAYPPKSLKMELCLEGNRLTYEILETLNVPYNRSGKWIVAFTPEEEMGLQRLLNNVSECSVPGITLKTPEEIAHALPWLKPVRATAFSETSGILDTSEYIAALDRVISSKANCQIVKSCRVVGIDTTKNTVETSRGPMQFDILINSAGLYADDIYKMAGGARDFEIRPFKGEYYTWKRGPIEGLIYPIPERFISGDDPVLVSSLGRHLHRSVSGEKYIGPTQLELPKDQKTDYRIETVPEVFAKAAAQYLKVPPNPSELEPAQAGNRPKLFEDGKAIGDFVFLQEGSFIHLLGIESPGLTAAPAIAKKVAAMVP